MEKNTTVALYPKRDLMPDSDHCTYDKMDWAGSMDLIHDVERTTATCSHGDFLVSAWLQIPF